MSILYQSRRDEMIVAKKAYWKPNPEGVSWIFSTSDTPSGLNAAVSISIIIWPFQGHKIGLWNMVTNSLYMVDYQLPDPFFFGRLQSDLRPVLKLSGG